MSVSSQQVDRQTGLQQSATDSLDLLQERLSEWPSPHVSLVMYGLFGSSLGTRYSTVEVDFQQVRAAVQHMWQDYLQPETSITLHLVRPQDDRQPDHLHLIVELTSPSHARPAGYLPILQRISWHNIWQGDTSAAVYRVPGLNIRQILAACSLTEWCGPSTRAICRIQVERRTIPISELIEFQVGSLLEVLVSLQHTEEDEASFLQSGTPVPANSRTTTGHDELHKAPLGPYMQSQQLGGRPKISVSMACHICRAYQRWQRDCGQNFGFLFLDLTEAFYRVLRPLAMGGQWNDETIAKMAQRLRLPDDVLADLHVKLQEPHSLELAGAPSHHQRYIRSLHQDTFFYVDGQTDICRTELGSRPQDSFADIIFGYLWARLLRQLQDDLQQVGLLEVVSQPTVLGLNGQHSSTELPLLGPTWCDDLAVVGAAASPNAIVSKMGTIASYLLDHCEAMAMTPNLKRGKTEILFGFAGKNSRSAKRTYFFHDNGGWLPVVCSHRTVHLHITGEYQHLGGLLHHGGDQRKEMKRRLAMAHVSFGEHRKLLFQNRDFTVERRFQLFRTLVLSKLVYGTESWILRTDKSRFGLHCAIIRLYRRLLRAAPDAHLTDDDICSQLGAVSPTVLLRVQRLRYLGLIYKTAGADIWAVFLHDKVWIELIKADLRWMYLQLHHSSSLKDPDLHFEEWEHILRQYPGFWKRLVNRAGEHSVLQTRRKNAIERNSPSPRGLCGGYVGRNSQGGRSALWMHDVSKGL